MITGPSWFWVRILFFRFMGEFPVPNLQVEKPGKSMSWVFCPCLGRAFPALGSFSELLLTQTSQNGTQNGPKPSRKSNHSEHMLEKCLVISRVRNSPERAKCHQIQAKKTKMEKTKIFENTCCRLLFMVILATKPPASKIQENCNVSQ